jgi:hypothetical protein
MSKKFKPPHDEGEIASCLRRVDTYKVRLARMLRENEKAERAEQVRKARVMTPAMLAVLKRLASREEFIKVIEACFANSYKPQYRIGQVGHWFALDKRLYRRLNTAGFICLKFNDTDSPIVISVQGREALNVAKGAS